METMGIENSSKKLNEVKKINGINDFSDETLVHIFSFIDELPCVAYDLPLVCKRWNALCKDPRAWGSVKLCSPPYDYFPDHNLVESRQHIAWMVSRAPYLKKLTISAFEIFPEDLEDSPNFNLNDMVVSALKRGPAKLKSLIIDWSPWGCLDGILQLLWRCRNSLHSVSIDLDFTDYEPKVVSERLMALYRAISEIKGLRSLSLYQSKPSLHYDERYSGAIGRECTSLTCLRLYETIVPNVADYNKNYNNPLDPVIGDIMTARAATLTEINVTSPFRLPRAMEEALAACPAVRSLGINLTSLEVVRDMHQLEDLMVWTATDLTQELTRHLEEFIAASPVMSQLKTLRVRLGTGLSGDSLETPNICHLLWVCGLHCKKVKTLELSLNRVPADNVSFLLSQFVELRNVKLGSVATIAHLTQVAELPKMRYLQASFKCCNEMMLDHANQEVCRLKQRRPDLVVKVRSSRFF